MYLYITYFSRTWLVSTQTDLTQTWLVLTFKSELVLTHACVCDIRDTEAAAEAKLPHTGSGPWRPA